MVSAVLPDGNMRSENLATLDFATSCLVHCQNMLLLRVLLFSA
jgi:hypothetical protein